MCSCDLFSGDKLLEVSLQDYMWEAAVCKHQDLFPAVLASLPKKIGELHEDEQWLCGSCHNPPLKEGIGGVAHKGRVCAGELFLLPWHMSSFLSPLSTAHDITHS